MSITVNNGGALKTLSTITVNDGGVLRALQTVTTNDGGALREIFNAYNVTFSQSLFGDGMSGEYSVSTTYTRGDNIEVIIAGTSANTSSGIIVQIWFPFIKSGDTVSMTCTFSRVTKGYYITSLHYNSDGSVAAQNGFHDNGLHTGYGPSYTVSYTSTTDGNFIQLLDSYPLADTLTFTVDTLTLNGTTIF